MFNLLVTYFRGARADRTEQLADAIALPVLRQQLRDSAASVETARRAVAVVMAHAEREKKNADRIASQKADLEDRALAALAAGKEALAAEAAQTIAHLEAEHDVALRAIATYETEIANLRAIVSDSELRLRELERGQKLAVATDKTQRLRAEMPQIATSSLAQAEATLARLQERQAHADATRLALNELTTTSNAAMMRDRLAAAGCGAALRPDAQAVLERLKAKIN
ncbi:PspA/IM30 family protein [Frigidibacter sp. SD6-1]|uniref:PspA/IM30 family protein n=1 Tax=Frigidibacter sp. SD6-1 TaxID=3032581 RepID=UPI0024DFA547|nr:PspA/IM30 family protein [Frigidibacter sp. SD6-1]